MTMRCKLNHIVKHVIPAVAGIAIALSAVSAAHAGSFTFGKHQRTINAGILLLDQPNSGPFNSMVDSYGLGTGGTNGGTFNMNPYIFYVLNQRTDIKPYGWTFSNPLAPPNVTFDILARWNARTTYDGPGSPGQTYFNSVGSVYQLGQQVTENMAPYWEVNMSQLTPQSIDKFNILYLRLRQGVRIRRRDAELLLSFVEGGGTLWIEGGPGDGLANPDDLFVDPTIAANGGALGANVPVFPITGGVVPFRAPIISSPYLLSQNELTQLGTLKISNAITDLTGLLSPIVLGGSSNGPAAISAVQYGAGVVVVTSTGSGDEINGSVGGIPIIFAPGYGSYNAGPYSGIANVGIASANVDNALGNSNSADLKLAVDIIAWTGDHPQEHKNAHQNSDGQEELSNSVANLWTYTNTAGAGFTPGLPLSGATIYGDLTAYTDLAGVVHVFDINPAEHLFGTQSPDDGIPDYQYGTSYDEIWKQPVGVFASAPTFFTRPAVGASGSAPCVAVQRADGTIAVFNALTGIPDSVAAVLPNSLSGGTYSSTSTGLTVAPSPTFFGTRVYCAQFNGSKPFLYVYDYATGSTANAGGRIAVQPAGPWTSGGGAEYPTAPASIAMSSEPQPTDYTNLTNDIVGYVTTNHGLDTLFLGSRNEKLIDNNGTATTRLAYLNANLKIDTAGSTNAGFPLAWNLYQYSGYIAASTSTFTNNQFTNTMSGLTGVFGSYDVDLTFPFSSAASVLGRMSVALTSEGDMGTAFTPTTVTSAAVQDGRGNTYYTSTRYNANSDPDSTLVCVRDSFDGQQLVRVVRWRFRLPYFNEPVVDADGTNYGPLEGAVFQGAPVVDGSGNVYATAGPPPGGTNFAVLSFNGNQDVTADIPNGTNSGETAIVQPRPVTNGLGVQGDEFSNNEIPTQLDNSQFTVSKTGNIDFTEFGKVIPGAPLQLYPDLCEPEPIQVSVAATAGQAGAGIAVGLHSNLNWFAVCPNPLNYTFVSETGPTLVGDTLYVGATIGLAGNPTQGALYSIYTDPGSISAIAPGRIVNPSVTVVPGKSEFEQAYLFPAGGLTSVGATPASANGRLVTVGPNGLAAIGSQTTLIADSNRLVEMDAAGEPTWALDSTTETTAQNTAAPAGSIAQQFATTKVDFNRPSSISQLSANDYLVVDTGNNRCVQVDRAGHVLWEVNRFYKNPTNPGLLAPGESYKLDQPTSIQVVRTFNPTAKTTTVHYLIADSGNYRIVEVDDNYNSAGTLIQPAHVLGWVSHTYDGLGRKYRYQSAAYYTDALGHNFVAALVNNARIAPFHTPTYQGGTMAPASRDGQGSSIVLLDYGTVAGIQTDGYIASQPGNGGFDLETLSTFQSFVNPSPNPKFDQSLSSANKVTVPLRNPRYMSVYTSGTQGASVQRFLLADDNGTYDLQFGGGVLTAQWGYTPWEYQNMQAPIDVNGETATPLGFNRGNVDFTPSCVQRTGAGKYLITNSFSYGDSSPTGVPPVFKGEAFEVQAMGVNVSTRFSDSIEVHTLPGPIYTGHTFAYSLGTSPLTQPLFAMRPL